ncbi:MAG: DUF2085 domain-containing protein [Chloroflexi bacterium]|nr:MAG: DUF2085 domain-containing protein [Chloroflexota bacterium]
MVRTYSLEQILSWGADPHNLRAFVGNAQIGYKTALNHRMLAIFTAIFFGGLLWGLRRGRPRLGPGPFLLMALPLLVDGFSHLYAETRGLTFRQTNAWAVWLTGGVFPDWFYTGSTFGSLNWLLRTVTGLLFGLGLVWFLYTYMDTQFSIMRRRLTLKLGRRSVLNR